MKQQEKSSRMRELVDLLNRASKAYYAQDDEIMSNYEYDRLYDELVQLEKETGVILANSPTIHVGYEAVDELPKERHEKPMLSLAKTKSREELRDRMIIQVISATEVLLYSGLLPERDRETLFEVNALLPQFEYGREYDQESFLVSMQSCFMPSEDREAVTILASNITNTQEQAYSDNGVTQQAVMKTGITTKENVLVPNPVNLIPYRTFLEVEQPASDFIFRISEGRGGAPHYATVQPNQKSCDKIEEILLCNVGGIVGMDISINQGFKKDKISELHFYYNENQDFRESYDFKGEISPSITELEERDGVLK